MELLIDTNLKCKTCYGRGWTGVVTDAKGQRHRAFCPKCVLKKARAKMKEMNLKEAQITPVKEGVKQNA